MGITLVHIHLKKSHALQASNFHQQSFRINKREKTHQKNGLHINNENLTSLYKQPDSIYSQGTRQKLGEQNNQYKTHYRFRIHVFYLSDEAH